MTSSNPLRVTPILVTLLDQPLEAINLCGGGEGGGARSMCVSKGVGRKFSKVRGVRICSLIKNFSGLAGFLCQTFCTKKLALKHCMVSLLIRYKG